MQRGGYRAQDLSLRWIGNSWTTARPNPCNQREKQSLLDLLPQRNRDIVRIIRRQLGGRSASHTHRAATTMFPVSFIAESHVSALIHYDRHRHPVCLRRHPSSPADTPGIPYVCHRAPGDHRLRDQRTARINKQATPSTEKVFHHTNRIEDHTPRTPHIMPEFDLQPPPDDLYDTALTFLDVGMPDSALPYLLTLSRQCPSSPEIQEALAKAHYENQEYPQALNAIQQASSLDPTNYSYYTFMGYAYILCDRIQEASHAFATALQLQPQDCDALTGLSDTLLTSTAMQKSSNYSNAPTRPYPLTPRKTNAYVSPPRSAGPTSALSALPTSVPSFRIHYSLSIQHSSSIAASPKAWRTTPSSP